MSAAPNIEEQYSFLYPRLLDNDFNIKIAEKREFWDTRYPPQDIHTNIGEHGNFLCNEREFELLPHQLFVRNFLSTLTPYNGLLLYHGLGTGKTCSAISICEERRAYLKQINSNNRIFIIASPNVQENFKTQLFDERKLKKIDGVWNLRACTGNTYLSEINPMNMKDLPKKAVVREVKKIIRSSYRFMGYVEFSNLIDRILQQVKSAQAKKKILKKTFSNNLIVIDEVHNIRHSPENPKKKVGINLKKVVEAASNLKLLFLSATPMYNDHQEIIWLLNILNINDNRAPVEKTEIFNRNGTLIVNEEEGDKGEDTLIRKSIGYVSYVRGENPYTFPYRIWPTHFSKRHSLVSLQNKKFWTRKSGQREFYPTTQINGTVIHEPIQHLDLFMVLMNKYQEVGYNKIIEKTIKAKMTSRHSQDFGLGYEFLEYALQGLNFIYPYTLPIENIKELYGHQGLLKTMKFNIKKKNNFVYRANVKKKFGNIFSYDHLKNYSAKIFNIINTIKKSKGIILIYSQYIDAGCVPIALALEEMGITRYGRHSLFKTAPHPPIDYRTMKKEKGDDFIPAKYAMITGDSALSPKKNKLEMKGITDVQNINGEIVKVIIISKAGAEGLDFKNIRQVHILEPWYNLNRPEQVIGRAVRNCSHKNLPFSERNVEIFLYGSQLNKGNIDESVDLYIYRKAEMKAIKIGRISRILKKNAADCILNRDYNNFSIDRVVSLQISSQKKEIQFNIKDKSFSAVCDYMENCKYLCSPTKAITDINDDTYTEEFIVMNMNKIIQRIRSLMREQFVYKRENLIASIQVHKNYSVIQIDMALNKLVNDDSEYVTDMFNRLGNLVNIGKYYMFQPLELKNKQITHYERSRPISYKRSHLIVKIPKKIHKPKLDNILSNIKTNYRCAMMEDVECENEWYSSAYSAFEILSNPPFNIDKLVLKRFVCEHIFDSLSYENKLRTLNFLWGKPIDDAFYRLLKNIIETQFIITAGTQKIVPIILPKPKNYEKTFLLLSQGKWREVVKKDLLAQTYGPPIKKQFKKNNIANIFGLMGMNKKNNIIFKVISKSKVSKRNKKGFQCITQQKNKTLILLNQLMKEGPIDKWHEINFTMKAQSREDNTVVIERGFSRSKLCVIEEMIFRYYNTEDKHKSWFLSFFGTHYNKIEKNR